MENTAQPTVNNSPAMSSGVPHKGHKGVLYIILLAVVLVVGVGVGAVLDRFVLGGSANKVASNTETPASQQTEQVDASSLPVSLSLLKNPIINQWRAAVEGVLITKDDKTITLSENGTNIIIPLVLTPGEPRMTKFYDIELLETEGRGEISLDDITVGTRLRGDFFVVPGSASNLIVGSSFAIIR